MMSRLATVITTIVTLGLSIPILQTHAQVLTSAPAVINSVASATDITDSMRQGDWVTCVAGTINNPNGYSVNAYCHFTLDSRTNIAAGTFTVPAYGSMRVALALTPIQVTSLMAGNHTISFLDPTGAGPVRTFNVVLAGNSYTVTFNSQGGTTPDPPTKTVTNGSPYGPLATTSRAEYHMLGWYPDSIGANPVVTAQTIVSLARSQTLYAKWGGNPHTVYFDAQGGSTPSPTSKTVYYSMKYGTLATTSRDGHTFGGWWTGPGGTGAQVTSATSVTITTDQTLFALWVQAETTTSTTTSTSTSSTTAPAALGEAVEQPGMAWTRGGSQGWRSQAAISKDGADAAQSGTIAHNQQSWMQTTVNGATSVGFWWKLAAETNDTLTFAIDGTPRLQAGGTQDWRWDGFDIPAGAHTLTWTYTKNASGSAGSDAAWVDGLAVGLFGEAYPLGGGWFWSDWFGSFNTAFAPWLYHNEHAWLYPFGQDPHSVVFWDGSMNAFWWTGDAIYSSMYRFSDNSWLWYQPGTRSPRWFLNLKTGAWEQR